MKILKTMHTLGKKTLLAYKLIKRPQISLLKIKKRCINHYLYMKKFSSHAPFMVGMDPIPFGDIYDAYTIHSPHIEDPFLWKLH